MLLITHTANELLPQLGHFYFFFTTPAHLIDCGRSSNLSLSLWWPVWIRITVECRCSLKTCLTEFVFCVCPRIMNTDWLTEKNKSHKVKDWQLEILLHELEAPVRNLERINQQFNGVNQLEWGSGCFRVFTSVRMYTSVYTQARTSVLNMLQSFSSGIITVFTKVTHSQILQ